MHLWNGTEAEPLPALPRLTERRSYRRPVRRPEGRPPHGTLELVAVEWGAYTPRQVRRLLRLRCRTARALRTLTVGLSMLLAANVVVVLVGLWLFRRAAHGWIGLGQ